MLRTPTKVLSGPTKYICRNEFSFSDPLVSRLRGAEEVGGFYLQSHQKR